jgi:hypothetical protein
VGNEFTIAIAGCAVTVAAVRRRAVVVESAALVAVTEQVPGARRYIVISAAPDTLLEQAPLAAKVTAPVPLPPEEPTVNVA